MIFNSLYQREHFNKPILGVDIKGDIHEYKPSKKYLTSQNTTPNSKTNHTNTKKEKNKRDNTEVFNAYVSKLSSFYENQKENLSRAKSARDQSIREMMNSRINEINKNLPKLERDYQNSARNAYIDYMENKKALPEELSALGIKGGASESTITKLNTGYQNNLSKIKQNYKSSVDNVLSAIEKIKSQAYKELSDNDANYHKALADSSQRAYKDLGGIKSFI